MERDALTLAVVRSGQRVDVDAAVAAYAAGVPMSKVARLQRVSYMTLRDALVAAGVAVPPQGRRLSAKARTLTEEVLRQRYEVEGRSGLEIAREFGLSQAAVYRRMDAAGIRVRTCDPDGVLTPEFLRREYVERGRTAHEIAAETGTNHSTVLARAHAAGLPVRRPGQRAEHRRSKLSDELVEALYFRQGLLMTEVAARAGCSVSLVSRRVKAMKLRQTTDG